MPGADPSPISCTLDPIAVYRFALRCNDLPLADALARRFRGNADLARRAELELRVLPRGSLPQGAPGPGLLRRMHRAIARPL